jgi:hypothetical protein
MRRPIISVGSYSFPATKQRTCGYGNNCLGYALRSALLVTPQRLRSELTRHLELASPDEQHILATSVIEDCEQLRRSELVERAVEELSADCFIPADVFIHYVRANHRHSVVQKVNYVFLSELEEGDVYVPVFCHWEDRLRYPTHYIGCNRENTHYSTILVEDGELLNELLERQNHEDH